MPVLDADRTSAPWAQTPAPVPCAAPGQPRGAVANVKPPSNRSGPACGSSTSPARRPAGGGRPRSGGHRVHCPSHPQPRHRLRACLRVAPIGDGSARPPPNRATSPSRWRGRRSATTPPTASRSRTTGAGTAAARAQERYYSSYGDPETLTRPQSPSPSDDTPWLPLALSIAITLVIATASATHLRRLRIRRRRAARVASVAHSDPGARLTR